MRSVALWQHFNATRQGRQVWRKKCDEEEEERSLLVCRKVRRFYRDKLGASSSSSEFLRLDRTLIDWCARNSYHLRRRVLHWMAMHVMPPHLCFARVIFAIRAFVSKHALIAVICVNHPFPSLLCPPKCKFLSHVVHLLVYSRVTMLYT